MAKESTAEFIGTGKIRIELGDTAKAGEVKYIELESPDDKTITVTELFGKKPPEEKPPEKKRGTLLSRE